MSYAPLLPNDRLRTRLKPQLLDLFLPLGRRIGCFLTSMGALGKNTNGMRLPLATPEWTLESTSHAN